MKPHHREICSPILTHLLDGMYAEDAQPVGKYQGKCSN